MDSLDDSLNNSLSLTTNEDDTVVDEIVSRVTIARKNIRAEVKKLKSILCSVSAIEKNLQAITAFNEKAQNVLSTKHLNMINQEEIIQKNSVR